MVAIVKTTPQAKEVFYTLKLPSTEIADGKFELTVANARDGTATTVMVDNGSLNLLVEVNNVFYELKKDDDEEFVFQAAPQTFQGSHTFKKCLHFKNQYKTIQKVYLY